MIKKILISALVLIMLLSTYTYTINTQYNPLNPLNSHTIKRGIIGSQISGNIWTISTDTIAYNETIQVDYIVITNYHTLTLKNCTVKPLSLDRVHIRFDNGSWLYAYDTYFNHIKFYSHYIWRFGSGFYDMTFKIFYNFSAVRCQINDWFLPYGYGVSYAVPYRITYVNIILHYTKIYNSEIFISDIFLSTPPPAEDTKHHRYYENIEINYCYFFKTRIVLFTDIIEKWMTKVSAYKFEIKNSIFDNNITVPEQPPANNLDEIYNYIYQTIRTYPDKIDTEYIVFQIKNPYVHYNLDNITFNNIPLLLIEYSTLRNIRFNNIGLLLLSGCNGKLMTLNMVQIPIFLSTISTNYQDYYVHKALKWHTIMNNINSSTPVIIVSSNFGYGINYNRPLALDLTNINAPSIYTILTSEGMGFCENTYVNLTNIHVNDLILVKNYTYKDKYNNYHHPYPVYLNLKDIYANNLILDNFSVPSNSFEKGAIYNLMVIKNSHLNMKSVKFNYIDFHNSTINASYKVTVDIKSVETTNSKIYNKIHNLIYQTSQKKFSVYLLSFTTSNASGKDTIEYHYPYYLRVDSISDSVDYTIDPLLEDKYIVIYIGTYVIEAQTKHNSPRGWRLIPYFGNQPASALQILQSNSYIKSIAYVIGGHIVFLVKEGNKIYGNDFMIKPFTSFYVYLLTNEKVNIIFNAVYSEFNNSKVKLSIGLNYIAVPFSISVANFFAFNPYISYIIIANETGYYKYTPYTKGISHIFITPNDGLIAYSTSNAKYLKLY